MASNKEGKLSVSFDESGVGFKVKGMGLNMEFQTLGQFHEAARAEGLKEATRDGVVRSVIKHYGEADAASPLDTKHLPEVFKGMPDVFVTPNRGAATYEVALPFHRDVTRELRKVPGAQFVADKKVWSVPLEARGALISALEESAQTLIRDEHAKVSLQGQLAELYAGDVGVDLKVSDYHRKNWISQGEIVAANGYYAAQMTGQSQGEVRILIHQQTALNRQVFVGDDVGIKYNEKGVAAVLNREELLAEFAEMTHDKLFSTLGDKIDGITVNKLPDGSMLVDIDHRNSSRAAAALHRMDKFLEKGEKVAFDPQLKGFVVPAAALAAPGADVVFAKAVADGRREIREDNAARAEVLSVALAKLVGAKVSFPIPKAPEWQEGTILFVNDRYALQASGREFMKVHDLRNLAQQPVEGQVARISYQGTGKALVEQRMKGQGQTQGLDKDQGQGEGPGQSRQAKRRSA
jgi:hypothetical protein